jgi:hypothetical protein
MTESKAFLFNSTSKETTSLLHISFAEDPAASLGVALINCDNVDDTDRMMFLPAFGVTGKMLPGDTVARRAGVQIGDAIVAVNGQGFRRFKPDKDEVVESLNGVTVELDNAVIEPGTAYKSLLAKIKEIKASSTPLVLTLERYGWDGRPNAWLRFMSARKTNVPEAMHMLQEHIAWKQSFFPIDLRQPGIQLILKTKAISEIDIGADHDAIPCVYVEYGKLINMQSEGSITAEDVVAAFVLFTERMLAKSKDARSPKVCQFIDLSGVTLTGSTGFSPTTLRTIYNVFEPNYPETLYKLIMYPVNTMVKMSVRTMLSFVNENTQKKFVTTNSLETVCSEVGWDQKDIEDCGGMTEFMHKHEKGSSMMLE